MKTFPLTLLTPLFSKGSYDDAPEVRPPSIRGQLHWWFRALGGSHAEEAAIFGSVHGGATASKLVVRVSQISGESGTPDTLPHKHGRHASPKAAYLPGTTFNLHILERLGGLNPDQRRSVDRTLNAWLLAGSLGLRATRGGGSFQWSEAPTDPESYRRQLSEIFAHSDLRGALLEPVFPTAADAHRCSTDTISHLATARFRFPLGAVAQSPADKKMGVPPRKTSPLRLTVRQFNDGVRLVAIWDGRTVVTGNTLRDLEEAAQLLASGSPQSSAKDLGRMLLNSAIIP